MSSDNNISSDMSYIKVENFKISIVPDVVPSHIIKWFAVNKFVLNLDYTNIMNFITKNSSYLHYIFVIKKSI